MEWTKRRNVNRGYMTLDVWNKAIDLFKLTSDLTDNIKDIDFRLRSQILGAVQSVSANIAEGYCRKSLKEYLQFLHIALGSSGEALTRMIGLKHSGKLSTELFEDFDILHYETENKLIALVKGLQKKASAGDWNDQIANIQARRGQE